MTQTERVIRALQNAGDRGITAVDFLLPDVIDGGKPITRLAARVLDARQDGVNVVTDGERNGCAVYKLAQAKGLAGVETVAAAPGPITTMVLDDLPDAAAGQLFELPTHSSAYREDAA